VRKNQLFTMGWCHHGELLLGRREAAYAAALPVDSAFDARSSRTMRCTRISVTDFFVLSLAAALALHSVTRKEGRPFAAILFSSPGDWVSFVFRNESVIEQTSTGEESRCGVLDGFMKVATFFFGGGTDYESPLNEARRLIEEGGADWREADVVFITDDCEVSEGFSERFRADKRRLCFKVFGVINGAEAENARAIWKFSERVLAYDGLRQILRHRSSMPSEGETHNGAHRRCSSL
jgi:hypothetical protein